MFSGKILFTREATEKMRNPIHHHAKEKKNVDGRINYDKTERGEIILI